MPIRRNPNKSKQIRFVVFPDDQGYIVTIKNRNPKIRKPKKISRAVWSRVQNKEAELRTEYFRLWNLVRYGTGRRNSASSLLSEFYSVSDQLTRIQGDEPRRRRSWEIEQSKRKRERERQAQAKRVEDAKQERERIRRAKIRIRIRAREARS